MASKEANRKQMHNSRKICERAKVQHETASHKATSKRLQLHNIRKIYARAKVQHKNASTRTRLHYVPTFAVPLPISSK
jgi:hypothetical protein